MASTSMQAGGAVGSASGMPHRSISSASTHSRARRRTTGMVVYHATEKDCVGENGDGEAECLICFEEFTVGDEMGRLECLCKFHKVSLAISAKILEMAHH